jgi:hypothetical protein
MLKATPMNKVVAKPVTVGLANIVLVPSQRRTAQAIKTVTFESQIADQD